MKDGLVAGALDKYVLSLEEDRELDGKYHPSGMFMCPRATILATRLLPRTSEPDAQAKRVFRIGHMYHGLVQDALPLAAGVKAVYPEFGIDIPEWNVTGHGDALVEMRDGSYWVIEIKSTKSLRYTPKDDHIRQASVYAVGARDFGYEALGVEGDPALYPPLGDKLQGIILVYLNKNDLEMKEYVYPYTPKWRKDIEAKIGELNKYRLVQIDDLPAPLPLEKGKPSWFISYCNYKGSGFCCGDPVEEDADAFDW